MEENVFFVSKKKLKKNVEDAFSFCEYLCTYNSSVSLPCQTSALLAEFSIDDLIEEAELSNEEKIFCHQNDFAFFANSWQSWGEGGEILPGQKQKKYFPVIPPFKKYISWPGKISKKDSKKNKNLKEGFFTVYARWNDIYLIFASSGKINFKENLPPVKFTLDSKKRKVYAFSYCDGKAWASGQKVAQVTVFFARGFFALRDGMKEIFACQKEKRFAQLLPLNASTVKKENGYERILTGGWESWYNHYNKISEKLILDDLENLSKTENLIKKYFIDKNQPLVFQVDDGWEKSLGEWTCNENLFPSGMENLSNAIVKKGFVPGLWLAPFIVDYRSDFCKRHRDWLLCDKKGKAVQAGFSFAWGAFAGKDQPGFPYSYFCYDLSKDEVLTFLDQLMDKVINEWGFCYIKLDFLFAGMLNGNFKNGGAAFEWYDRAIKILTSRKKNKNGQSVAYLGCGIPFESGFMDFPLSRIGPDTKEDWDYLPMKKFNFSARPGAYGSLKSCLGHAFWDQAVFVNDPDVVFMRYENIRLNDREKELIALTNFLFASQIMHSDDPCHFDSEKEEVFTKKIFDLYQKFENEEFAFVTIAKDLYVIYSRNGRYAGFINLCDKKMEVSKKIICDFLPAEKSYCVYKEIISYAEEKENSFVAEKHSISIYEV